MKAFFFLLFFSLCISGAGQNFYRIEADISIKEKTADGKSSLTMGKVYFDKNKRQIHFKLDFPEKQDVLITDSLIRIIDNGKIVQSMPSNNIVDLSILNLALNLDLDFYGLENSMYTLTETEKSGDMNISTWVPPARHEKISGKVMLSQKNRRIFGIVTFSPEGEVISKQFFEDYENFKGLVFPTKVTQFLYLKNGKEDIKITTYKNIRVNSGEDSNYTFELPVH